jgi:hypothetical protein
MLADGSVTRTLAGQDWVLRVPKRQLRLIGWQAPRGESTLGRSNRGLPANASVYDHFRTGPGLLWLIC